MTDEKSLQKLQDLIQDLVKVETNNFLKLARIAGLNPAKDFAGADLSDANLSGADLSNANLSGANLSSANLSDANLSGANLSGANLRNTLLSDADLSDANLSAVNLSDSNLSGADLSDANLSAANLRSAYLGDANLSGADLSAANLRSAYLGDANLSGADLRSAYLSSDQESPLLICSASFKADAVPRRILLVEDNDLNRQMLDDYLVVCGYQVLSLAGGSGFFQALTDFQPHLILLNLKLPDIDGYTLLQQIQHGSDWHHLPVIVVSNFAFKADRQRALSFGASRYFVKPVNLTDLKQTLQDELQR